MNKKEKMAWKSIEIAKEAWDLDTLSEQYIRVLGLERPKSIQDHAALFVLISASINDTLMEPQEYPDPVDFGYGVTRMTLFDGLIFTMASLGFVQSENYKSHIQKRILEMRVERGVASPIEKLYGGVA